MKLFHSVYLCSVHWYEIHFLSLTAEVIIAEKNASNAKDMLEKLKKNRDTERLVAESAIKDSKDKYTAIMVEKERELAKNRDIESKNIHYRATIDTLRMQVCVWLFVTLDCCAVNKRQN